MLIIKGTIPIGSKVVPLPACTHNTYCVTSTGKEYKNMLLLCKIEL